MTPCLTSSSNTGSTAMSRKSFLPLGANFVGKYNLRMTKNPRGTMTLIYGGAKILVENRLIMYCMINKEEKLRLLFSHMKSRHLICFGNIDM